MAKARVTLKFNGSLKHFQQGTLVDSATQKQLGSTVQSLMLESISKGLSPVQAIGRFVGYAASRNVAPASKGRGRKQVTSERKKFYPFSVQKKFPSKTLTPVNLFLDGSFLKSITYRAAKNGIELGHIDPDSHTEALFEAHNEGLNKIKKVPKRKYLPNKKGELFIVTIMRAIRDVYSQRIKSIINSD